MATGKGKARRANVRRTFLIGICILAAIYAAKSRYPDVVERAELWVFDFRMVTLRGALKPRGPEVIAAIDDKSVRELGQWPWPRAVLGQLVSALQDDKVAAIGFDAVISEPDAEDVARAQIAARLANAGLSQAQIAAALGPSNDEALARALQAQGSSYMGYAFQSHGSRSNHPVNSAGFVTSIIPPAPVSYAIVRTPPGVPPPLPTAGAYLPNIPIVAKAARGSAYFDIDEGIDAKIRSELLVVRFDGRYFAPLCLALVSAYRAHAQLSLRLDESGVERIALGAEEIPADERGRMLVNFRGPANTFPHYSAVDIIKHRVPAGLLKDRIVLVGVTGTGLGDRVATPFDDFYPGVEVHANAIDNILAGDFIHRSQAALNWEIGAAFALGLAVIFAAALLSARGAAAATAGLGIGWLAFAQFLLLAHGLLIGVVFPLAVIFATYTLLVSYRYFTEGLEKRHLRHAFTHYLHPAVIESLVDDPGALRLGGERRHLSILFSDVVGYTSRSERSSPEELVALLNTYTSAMIQLVLESGGWVDKMMGDGIMAFWGAPAPLANPARPAVDCALAMLKELKLLRERDERFRDFDIGIGIATGEAIVGNFGGERRLEYSVIGDTVNLASRIEGLTRHFKVHLLVTEQTLAEAGGAYIRREIGLVKVKGKTQAVPLVEVVAQAGDGVDPGFYQRFAQAMAALREGPRTQACTALEELEGEKPGDRVVEMYLERLRAPAGEANEIVFEFDTK
jgi:adenylate cyclase